MRVLTREINWVIRSLPLYALSPTFLGLRGERSESVSSLPLSDKKLIDPFTRASFEEALVLSLNLLVTNFICDRRN